MLAKQLLDMSTIKSTLDKSADFEAFYETKASIAPDLVSVLRRKSTVITLLMS
jgi:hypothetical protein